MQWTDGMLYPLLHRLERLGYVLLALVARPRSGAAASTTPLPRRGGTSSPTGSSSGGSSRTRLRQVWQTAPGPAVAEGWA